MRGGDATLRPITLATCSCAGAVCQPVGAVRPGEVFSVSHVRHVSDARPTAPDSGGQRQQHRRTDFAQEPHWRRAREQATTGAVAADLLPRTR